MFVGKRLLASLMISSAVMISSPEGTEISDSGIDVSALTASQVSGQDGEEAEETQFQEQSEVFRIQEETVTSGVPVLEGTSLAMLSSQGGAQMLSSVIRSENGNLIVVDGGWEADGDYLLETIKENGGTVAAWLITHPHSDHVGALYHILKNGSDEIDINGIYYSFAPVSWYEEVSPEDSEIVGRLVGELEKLPQGKLFGSIGKGYKITVDNLQVTAMNSRYQLDVDPVNNSSITYMLETGGKKVLFLGDMSHEGGNQLVRENGNFLKADIVQMAHHGQNGVGKSVYESIAPKICLWPTPQWLWDNDNGNGYDSGSWMIMQIREWMEDTLKVKENYCTKDGDIVLQLD